jgi:hypothetical protein
MSQSFLTKPQLKTNKRAPLPWLFSEIYSHGDDSSAEESSYNLALTADSFRRIQSPYDLAELEYFNPWLDEDLESWGQDLCEGADACNVSLNPGYYTSC